MFSLSETDVEFCWRLFAASIEMKYVVSILLMCTTVFTNLHSYISGIKPNLAWSICKYVIEFSL